MKLSEIIKKTIESMKDVSVSVNDKYGYLSISNGEDEIFLQGDDFNFFMQEFETIGDIDGITYEEKLLFVAELYTSVIWSN